MEDWTAGDYAGLFAGIVAMLAALGKGIAWLLNWHGERSERRSARLAEWEASLDRREKEQRESLEHRFASLEHNYNRLRSDVTALRGSLLEVTMELHALDPGSAAIAKAASVLAAAYPTIEDIPPEMRELVDRLDEGVVPGVVK